ncbi:ImmA/IrrE family metallo-endopeptidase [Mucilaginibacter boryungensis]|uniref:ImmA/IrrE family metallo-endopeptidase n=1 Tax=Mucilaginibacter boryungensis TaxID=768480 RepID=A0ABR9XLF3_9SPHI|nr:ImmA/IrrE family metallo-endopeptidase [Mucilaginibacter boryungensis]MBE9668217.1 ImmA/IrrE family metallo-endopeptidase [Mucilaginibacter boryungensis]
MALLSKFYKTIEGQIDSMLNQAGITNAPVPIESIAKSQGVQVVAYDLGNEISGVLVIDEGSGTIGYNQDHPPVRQRFTIGHELGHYMLHVPRNKSKELFVDKDFIVKFRSQKPYTQTEIRHEQEANAFAAAILMPKTFIIKEARNPKYANYSETKLIEELAKVFDVSVQAMTYRFADINLFS